MSMEESRAHHINYLPPAVRVLLKIPMQLAVCSFIYNVHIFYFEFMLSVYAWIAACVCVHKRGGRMEEKTRTKMRFQN